MGTCYSANKLVTNNSSTKRPYDKSNRNIYLKNRNFINYSLNSTNCHQLITPGYLATISSNQLIQINNQTNELKPNNSKSLNVNLNRSSFRKQNKSINNYKMIENKNKLISKLPKFNLNRQQVHDSSNLNQIKNVTTTTNNQINHHFNGSKQTLNADLLRLKNSNLVNGNCKQKSSNSSLTNSENSYGSSQSTNSTASYSNVNLNNKQRKLTFTKSTSSSILNEKQKPTTSSSLSNVNNNYGSKNRLDNKCVNNKFDNKNDNKVISKQPLSNRSALNSSNNSLNNQHLQFSQASTKLPTKFTTTLTSLPKPQIAQRIPNIKSNSSTNTCLSSNHQINSKILNSKDVVDCNKHHNQTINLHSNHKSTSLRPYTLKNTTTIDQQFKKPYTRNLDNNKLTNNNLRYPYSESNLKYRLTGIVNDDKSILYKQSNNKKTISSFSSLPIPNSQFRSSKSELRNSNSSLNCKSNDKLNQLNFNYQNDHQNNHINHQTTRSLTLEKNQNLEKENKRLSTSYQESSNNLNKNFDENINQIKSNTNKLLLNQTFSNYHKQNLKNQFNQLNNQLINNNKPNSIETTEDSNSINEQSCTNSQKSTNSPNSSLTPDLSNRSKVSPEHNRSDFLIDDEYCDQPDLMFLKDNTSSNSSPTKENINLVDNLIKRDNDLLINNSNNYKTNIRYSISELDSLKLKEELLSSSIKINDQNNLSTSISSSPEKLSNNHLNNLSPVKTFRLKPRPLSVVESENGDLALDGSSFRSVMQDINGIKTLLFRLQGELQKSETQNPFENILNASQMNQNLITNGLEEDETNKEDDLIKEDDKNLKIENQNLKMQLALMQQQLEEKNRQINKQNETIKLLQQQMTKYLNINESNTNQNNQTNVKRNSCNATTQTDRQNAIAPETKKQPDGIVVRSNEIEDHLNL